MAVQGRHHERQRLDQFQGPPQRGATHTRAPGRLRGPPPGDQTARRRRPAGRDGVLQAERMAGHLQPSAPAGVREGIRRRRDLGSRQVQSRPHSSRPRVRRPRAQGGGGPTLRSWSRHPRAGIGVHGGRQRAQRDQQEGPRHPRRPAGGDSAAAARGGGTGTWSLRRSTGRTSRAARTCR